MVALLFIEALTKACRCMVMKFQIDLGKLLFFKLVSVIGTGEPGVKYYQSEYKLRFLPVLLKVISEVTEAVKHDG